MSVREGVFLHSILYSIGLFILYQYCTALITVVNVMSEIVNSTVDIWGKIVLC